MTSLLLTGATGLVGTRLLPHLVEAGFDVRALVRKAVDLPDGAIAVHGDLSDPDSLAAAVEGVDAVVHLAALFRTPDEDAIWAANLDGTRHLLAAVEAGAPGARFVMTSTGRVYDADATRPARETDDCHPTAAYPASKIEAEALVRASPLTWSILRLPFVYGDGDGHLEAIPALAPQLGIHPARTASVAHHRDVMVAVDIALAGTMDGRIVNIADDAPLTFLEMAEFGGGSIEASAEPLPDPWSGRMDTSLAHELGFRPTVPTIHAAAREGIL